MTEQIEKAFETAHTQLETIERTVRSTLDSNLTLNMRLKVDVRRALNLLEAGHPDAAHALLASSLERQ